MRKINEDQIEALISNSLVQAAAAKYVLACQLVQSLELEYSQDVTRAAKDKSPLPEHHWDRVHKARMMRNAAEQLLLALQEATGVKG